jgi:hypothetical protein
MLIVISLLFIASWAFSPTSIWVNLLLFSTFHCSFVFTQLQYFHSVECDIWSDSMWMMWFCIQQNSATVYHTWPDRCPVFEYSRWPKFVQAIFCFWPYTWAVKLIRRVLHLGISFVCWFRGIRVLSCVFWSLPDWRSWCSWRQRARGFHSGWCTDTLGGLFECVPEIYLLRWIFFLV